jgi:hypothetical protein
MVELSVKVLVNVAEAFSPLKRNVSVRQLFVLLDVTCIQNNDKRVMSVGLCTKDTTSTLKKSKFRHDTYGLRRSQMCLR